MLLFHRPTWFFLPGPCCPWGNGYQVFFPWSLGHQPDQVVLGDFFSGYLGRHRLFHRAHFFHRGAKAKAAGDFSRTLRIVI